jgi:dTDP-4-dehydrorhamnose reductase
MKTLVIGSHGQLGTDMVAMCQAAGHDTIGIDFPEIDITDRPATAALVEQQRPELIVNCAAFTAVDECEAKQERAFAINRDGVANIALAAQKTGSRVVHFSTDYVFDGLNTEPYVESDQPRPATIYGESKLAGEQALIAGLSRHYIFRIAWLYGLHGSNFVKTIRRVAAEKAATGGVLWVVNDQFGTPTYTREVIRQMLAVVDTEEYGLYHCTAEGFCSWYDFARLIVDQAGIAVDLQPCTTAEYPRPAQRPPYSVLENRRLKQLGLHTMQEWRAGFAAFAADEQAAASK